MIKLNNTEARQGVKPLHQDQLQYMCESMSQSFSMKPNSMIMGQRLIDSYQNLQHFWDVVGGWEGYNKVKIHKEVYVFSSRYKNSDKSFVIGVTKSMEELTELLNEEFVNWVEIDRKPSSLMSHLEIEIEADDDEGVCRDRHIIKVYPECL